MADRRRPGRAGWMRTGRVLLRTRAARRRGDPGAALRALARDGGDAVGLRLRGRRVLLLLEPGLAAELLAGHAADTVKGPGQQRIRPLLGQGLLTSEGAAHDRARRLVAPAFSPRRLAGYADVFADCTRDLAGHWADGAQIDTRAEMAALTLRVAGRALLGTDLAAQAPLVRAGLEQALADFGAAVLGGPAGPEWPGGLQGKEGAGEAEGPERRGEPVGAQETAPDAAGQALHGLVSDLIRQRRAAAATDDGGDALSGLLAGAGGPGGLTDQEVHDHVLTLLLAGHETTASALTWTLWLLAGHTDVQQRLQAEVAALGGAAPGPGTLAGLRYTRAVVSEAVRLYPPAWIIGRTVTADLELAGRRLPAGSVAAVSPLLLHHDPRWFPDPERFDPGRWLDERREAVPRHAYLPFGTGPRACIGEQFAWAEAVSLLALLAQQWTFRAAPGATAEPAYRVTLRPAGPVALTVHRARLRGV